MLTAQCFSFFYFRVEGSEVPSLCTVDPEARAQPELACFSLGGVMESRCGPSSGGQSRQECQPGLQSEQFLRKQEKISVFSLLKHWSIVGFLTSLNVEKHLCMN